ncbi:hypothetical protein RRG08_050175 [Elysia crispata]|uniref:Uncharacterized protein n=1 Tax=Elysia crispata TaxID=231223 RepID=A0AAE0Y009_9GAST|nr:hypothetical protein RRG08_050175 [Elysia crispata]
MAPCADEELRTVFNPDETSHESKADALRQVKDFVASTTQVKPSSDHNRRTSNRVLSSRSHLKPGAGLLSLWTRHRPTSGAGQSLKQENPWTSSSKTKKLNHWGFNRSQGKSLEFCVSSKTKKLNNWDFNGSQGKSLEFCVSSKTKKLNNWDFNRSQGKPVEFCVSSKTKKLNLGF